MAPFGEWGEPSLVLGEDRGASALDTGAGGARAERQRIIARLQREGTDVVSSRPAMPHRTGRMRWNDRPGSIPPR